jgi:hypothetical protein
MPLGPLLGPSRPFPAPLWLFWGKLFLFSFSVLFSGLRATSGARTRPLWATLGKLLLLLCFFLGASGPHSGPPLGSFWGIMFLISFLFGHQPQRYQSPLILSHMDVHSFRMSVCPYVCMSVCLSVHSHICMYLPLLPPMMPYRWTGCPFSSSHINYRSRNCLCFFFGA